MDPPRDHSTYIVVWGIIMKYKGEAQPHGVKNYIQPSRQIVPTNKHHV